MNARSGLRLLVGAMLLAGTAFVAACGSDHHVTTTTTTTDRTVTTEQPANPMAEPDTSTTRSTTTQRSHD